ncbi:deoxyribodipyrimidine photo-lyase [Alosa sapidissima]|uniref:deoxyribodipyrimidine photo-lyase n=1 Tax=Alosa sapidissima TaxID=34773 RepID=UPI001C0A530B|nr:deoxyribodipyrimidine photo-lyase [Alosa sapidissima]
MPVDSRVSQVRHLLRELLAGREDPESFFCFCVSILGHQETRVRFRELISPITYVHHQLHSQLLSIYQEYFLRDVDDELELALALSLVNTNQTSTQQPVPRSYAQLASATPAAPVRGHTQGMDTDISMGTHKTPGWTGKSPNVPKTPDRPKESVTNKTATTENKGKAEATSSLANDNDSQEKLDADNQSEMSRKSRRRRQRKRQQQLLKSPSSPRPILMWFRRDLRLLDNPALIGCLELGGPVIPLFLWNDQEEEGPGVTVAAGGACKYWLHQALVCLNQALERIGSHLLTVKAEPSSAEVLQRLVKETGAGTVVATALYEPWLKERDEGVASTLQQQGISWQLHHSYCLRDPYTVTTQGVGLRGIGSVSHFMSCCQQNPTGAQGTPLDAPPTVPVPSTWPTGCPLEQLGLARMPRRKDGTTVDWAVNIRRDWDFTEEGAHARLEAFLQDGVYRYEKESGWADAPNTSCVSPYLHWGQLSPRWLLWDARAARCRSPKFQRKLAWRDLAYWQLTLFPDLPWESLRPPYKALRWSSERAHLRVWQKGTTGYPLVDAAMRQLWQTGWMNNYMRHVVASFLVAYLHLPWQEGYRWFQDTLVDADVAIDAMMWQNGGMSGLDHWNFVMHPVDAAMTCDPIGTYVRRWCPELAPLPDELIHKPWKCPTSILRRAGVVLGQTYPERVVTDLEERRTQSLRDVAEVRQRFKEYVDQHSGCDLVPLPDRLVEEALGSTGEVLRCGSRFLLPVITRMEFKHQTADPDKADGRGNPYNAVLKGYVSRKRDETIAFLNERDFTASVMHESTQQRERAERHHCLLEGLPASPSSATSRGRPRRTPAKDPYSIVPGGVAMPQR